MHIAENTSPFPLVKDTPKFQIATIHISGGGGGVVKKCYHALNDGWS
jgi:hypothetical protein